MFTDSHFHADAYLEAGTFDEIVKAALAAGVCRLVAIGGTPPANRRAADAARRYPEHLIAAIGHDRELAALPPSPADLRPLLDQPGVVAIGETGLDYHHDRGSAEEQKDLFRAMLNLAAERTLPVVVHSRDAEEDTLRLLSEHAGRWRGDADRIGVLHCFTGSEPFARRLLDLGLCIGFSGIVTFKNAEALRGVAAVVPEERLLIETDAPYLAPVPYRGRQNQPAHVIEVAAALAKIRHDSVERIADSTTRNAARLFGGWETRS